MPELQQQLVRHPDPDLNQLALLGRPALLLADFLFKRHLGERMTPDAFVTAAYQAIEELRQGVDSRTCNPIQGRHSEITHQPPLVYSLLDLSIPSIAETFLPTEFAQGVKAHWDEVQRQRRELPPQHGTV